MSKSMYQAILPIKTLASHCATKLDDGKTLARAPNPELGSLVMDFVKAWSEWRQGGCKEPKDDNTQYLEQFFDEIEEMCLLFKDYDVKEDEKRIKLFNEIVGILIPWESLPEETRQLRLRTIFQQQEFRLQLWRHFIERFNQRRNLVTQIGIGMNVHVARALLEHEDIRADFACLPLETLLTFSQAIPDLMLKTPALLLKLSTKQKKAFIQHQLDQIDVSSRTQFVEQVYADALVARNGMTMAVALQILRPLTTATNTDAKSRFQANYFVADIHIQDQNLGFAKRYLDVLKDAGDALSPEQHAEVILLQMQCATAQRPYSAPPEHLKYCNLNTREQGFFSVSYGAQQSVDLSLESSELIEALLKLNANLDRYLSEHKVGGFFYTLGIYNVELSTRKNKMVEGIQLNITGHIESLRAGGNDEQASRMAATELMQQLSDAEQKNSKYCQKYRRWIIEGIWAFDGVGQLGNNLHAEAEALKSFVPSVNSGHAG